MNIKELMFRSLGKYFLLSVFAIAFLASCNTQGAAIDRIEDDIAWAEQNESDLEETDIEEIGASLDEIDSEIDADRQSFTDQEIKDFRKLQGRYAAIIAKRAASQLGDKLKDFGNQVEGFIDALTDSTQN